ncbi:kelch-like protein 21 [Babylonia areolata]|uniref:kelch-like protein 21 n=1 Tax=Babylonia areolata TaxID=304850 RepID=UPI003FD67DA0
MSRARPQSHLDDRPATNQSPPPHRLQPNDDRNQHDQPEHPSAVDDPIDVAPSRPSTSNVPTPREPSAGDDEEEKEKEEEEEGEKKDDEEEKDEEEEEKEKKKEEEKARKKFQAAARLFESPEGSSRSAVELQQGLLQMYRKQELTDVSIKVDNSVFRCHRAVLCAVSTLFSRLLTEDPERRMVIFKNGNSQAFHDVVEYIYTGRVTVTDNFQEFINLVLKLEITALAGKVGGFLEGNVDVENCMSAWKFASENPDMTEMAERAERLVVENFFSPAVQSQLRHLSMSELLRVLDHEDLKAENEEMVVRAALEWMKANDARGPEASALFLRLRLPLTSIDFIQREVESMTIVKEDPACRAAVMEAMTYLSHPERRHESHSKHITYRGSSPEAEVMMVFGGYKLYEGKAKDCVALDLGEGTWHTFSPISHHPGKGMATCVYSNDIYVSGGSSDPQAFWIYVTKEDRWQQGPALSCARRFHCMELVPPEGTAYVMGGTVEVEVSGEEGEEGEGAQQQYEEEPVLEVEVLVGGGGGGGEWREVMELLLPVSEAASCVTYDGSKIYLCGGKITDGQPTNSIQCLDLRSRTCSLLSHKLPVACAGAVGLRSNATFYMLSTKGEVMKLDPDTAKLISVDKLPYFKRRRFRLVCHHDRLLVIGGEEGSNMQKVMLCIPLDDPSLQMVPWENFVPPVRAHFGLAKIVVNRRVLGEGQW